MFRFGTGEAKGREGDEEERREAREEEERR